MKYPVKNRFLASVASSRSLGKSFSPAIAALLISFTGAHAQGVWDGTTGNFDVATNWDDDMVPGAINIVVNNGGTIQVTTDHTTNDILAGTATPSSGTWAQSAGNITMGGGWFRLGTAASSSGTYNLSGGTLTTVGRINVGEANGGTGTVNVSGTGVWTNNGDQMAIGGPSGEAGGVGFGFLTLSDTGQIINNNELWIGENSGSVGSVIISGGTFDQKNWLAVGRKGGQGTLTMSGGTLNKTGGGNITISTGTGGTGTVSQSGGVINATTSLTFVGESWNGDGNGTWTHSGTAVANLGEVIVGNGGACTGTVNLNGGTFVTPKIRTTSTGTTTINFNGGTLRPSVSEAAFLAGLTRANVRNGVARIDTNGFDITIGQNLLHSNVGGDNAVDGGLNKLGAGTLTLGGANTFNGDTIPTAGSLVLANANALGGSALNYDNQGGTVSFGVLTAATFGGLKGAQNLALTNITPAAVTLTVGANNANHSYSGNLSGDGSLAKTGTGVQTLTGTNSYTGTTAVNAGALTVGSLASLAGSGTPGKVSVAAGAVLAAPVATDINTFRGSLGNVSFAAGSYIGADTSAGDAVYASNIVPTGYTGDPGFAKVGANTLTLSGNNTYTGGTLVSGGTLIAGSANAFGTGPISLSGTGTFDTAGFGLTQTSLILAGGVQTGSGTLTLSSTGSAIAVTGGYAFATPAVGASLPISLTGGSGGSIVKTATGGNPVIASAIHLGGLNRTIALADTPGDAFPEMTLSGVISNGSLTLDNGFGGTSGVDWGSLLLSGANTYDGATIITKGRLEITNATSLGTTVGGTSIGALGTLAFGGSGQAVPGGGISVAENLTINRITAGNYGLVAIQNNSGDNTLSGTVSLSATAEISSAAGSLSFTGDISETAPSGLTLSGGASVILAGDNAYTGLTSVNAGELVAGSDTALGTTAAGTAVASGARLVLADEVTVTAEPLAINGTGGNLGGALQAAANAFATWDGDITLNSTADPVGEARIGAQGFGTLVVEGVISTGTATGLAISGLGGTGEVELTGNNTYTGVTTVIRGGLIVNGGSINTGANVNIGTSGSGDASHVIVENGGVIDANIITLSTPTAAVVSAHTWDQESGTVSTKEWASFGFSGAGTADADMTGGVLNVKTVAAAGGQAFELGVFDSVTSTFTLSGSAAVNLQNNADIAIGSQNNIANNTFNQEGGTVTFFSDGGSTAGGTGLLKIGQNGTGNNTYNLNGGTLIANQVTRTSGGGSGTLNFNGGTLKPTAATATFVNALTRANVRDGGAIIDTAGVDVTIPQDLVHSDLGGDAAVDGGLTKQGAGILTLAGANSYTGDTTVSAGTLELLSDSGLDDGSAVNLTTGAILNLNFVGTDNVAALTIDGGGDEATGTWGSLASSADHKTALITGSGLLNVGAVATPYETWATVTNGLAGGNALPGADPDNDSYKNLAEFILGGQPNPANPGAGDVSALAPTVATSGATRVFSFRRSQLAAAQPGLAINYEYGSTLTGWTTAVHGVDSITIVVTSDGYGTGIDRVDVTIPNALAPTGKLFARMNAVQVP